MLSLVNCLGHDVLQQCKVAKTASLCPSWFQLASAGSCNRMWDRTRWTVDVLMAWTCGGVAWTTPKRAAHTSMESWAALRGHGTELKTWMMRRGWLGTEEPGSWPRNQCSVTIMVLVSLPAWPTPLPAKLSKTYSPAEYWCKNLPSLAPKQSNILISAKPLTIQYFFLW